MATKKAGEKATGKQVFSAEERAAMKERAKEEKANAGKEEEAKAVDEKIAGMNGKDKVLAQKIHALVKAAAPNLAAKLWYGQPAYALDGKIVCFFQPSEKFGTRYSTLGFNEPAKLDDGSMWPTAFAVLDLTAADEAKITALVKKAVAGS